MDAEPEGVHLDYSQVVTRRLLQAFRDAGRKADLHPGGQPHDHPIAPGVVVRALGPWPAQTRLSARFCRFELLVVSSTMISHRDHALPRLVRRAAYQLGPKRVPLGLGP